MELYLLMFVTAGAGGILIAAAGEWTITRLACWADR
jgi:hypothetical protein